MLQVYQNANQLGQDVAQGNQNAMATYLNPVVPTVNDNAMAARLKALQYANTAGAAPQFDFSPAQNGDVADAFGKAFGNVNQALGYRRQQKQNQAMNQGYLDIANKYQTAEDAKAQADHDQKVAGITLGNQALAIINNPTATPEQRLQAQQTLNAVSGGQYFITLGDKAAQDQLGFSEAGQQGQADANKAIGTYDAMHAGAATRGINDPSLNTNNPNPTAINDYTQYYGKGPVTYQDTYQKKIGNARDAQGLIKDTTDNQFNGPMHEAQLGSAQAEASLKNIELKFAPLMKNLELQAKDTSNKKAQQDLANAQELQLIHQQIVDHLKNGGTLSNDEIAKIQIINAGLTGKAADIPAIIKALQNPKAGQAVDASKVFTGGGQPSTMAIPPAAVHGDLVQSPKTGLWYNKTTGQPVTAPAQAAKPKSGLMPAKPAAKPQPAQPVMYKGQPVTKQGSYYVLGQGHMVNGQMHYNDNQYINADEVQSYQRYQALNQKAKSNPNALTQDERNQLFSLARQYDPSSIKGR